MLECRNAQIRRCCISRTWKARFPEVSSRFLLQMYRTSVREGVPHEPEQKRRPRGNAQGRKSMKKAAKKQALSAKRKQAEAKRPKGGKSGKPRRRFRTKQGRQRNIGTGQRQGGGGWHRAAVSKFLRGLKWRDEEERKFHFRAANQYALDLAEAQDDEFAEVLAKGRAATVSRRNGGVSFPWRREERQSERPPRKRSRRSNEGDGLEAAVTPSLSSTLNVGRASF